MCQTDLPSFKLAQLGHDCPPQKCRALDTDSTPGIQKPVLAHWRSVPVHIAMWPPQSVTHKPYEHVHMGFFSKMHSFCHHKLNSTGAHTLLACKDSSSAEGWYTVCIFLYAVLLASCILPPALWCVLGQRLYVITLDNVGSEAFDNMKELYEAVLIFAIHIPPTSCAYYRCLHLALYIEMQFTFQMPLLVLQAFSSSRV